MKRIQRHRTKGWGDVILEWFEDHPLVPASDERPVFGLHRQVEADAETAPAWPSLTSLAAKKVAGYRRFLRDAR